MGPEKFPQAPFPLSTLCCPCSSCYGESSTCICKRLKFCNCCHSQHTATCCSRPLTSTMCISLNEDIVDSSRPHAAGPEESLSSSNNSSPLGLRPESVAAFPEVHAGPRRASGIVLVAPSSARSSHAATAANPVQCILLPALAAPGHLPYSTALSGPYVLHHPPGLSVRLMDISQSIAFQGGGADSTTCLSAHWADAMALSRQCGGSPRIPATSTPSTDTTSESGLLMLSAQ